MNDVNTLIAKIKDWRATTDDLEDSLHHYFEATGVRHWPEVAEQGRLTYELITGETLEYLSPVDSLLAAVAAQAASGVQNAFVAALGLNPKYVGLVIAHWLETPQGEDYPPPISLDEFKRRCEQEEKEWEERDGSH